MSIVTPILEVGKLRPRDVKCLPKVTHFVSSRTILSTESLLPNSPHVDNERD